MHEAELLSSTQGITNAAANLMKIKNIILYKAEFGWCINPVEAKEQTCGLSHHTWECAVCVFHNKTSFKFPMHNKLIPMIKVDERGTHCVHMLNVSHLEWSEVARSRTVTKCNSDIAAAKENVEHILSFQTHPTRASESLWKPRKSQKSKL